MNGHVKKYYRVSLKINSVGNYGARNSNDGRNSRSNDSVVPKGLDARIFITLILLFNIMFSNS